MGCVPTSLSQEVGAALGAQAGEARLREVISAGGFRTVRRIFLNKPAQYSNCLFAVLRFSKCIVQLRDLVPIDVGEPGVKAWCGRRGRLQFALKLQFAGLEFI